MEIKNVTFSHTNSDTLHLNQISESITRNKITTIIGPNGSGKSTLLGVMSNHYRPRNGTVLLEGKQITAYKLKEFARKLTVVHQENSAPSDLTVERLVAYGRLPHKGMFASNSKEDEAAIEWALRETNLVEQREKTLDALSGGQRQRVWIAMSLAQQTPYLFLDEPTTFLDVYYQYEILDLVKRLNEEHQLTIVMVLHDINQAIRYSDEIIVMQDGEIITKGIPSDIITRSLMQDIYGIDVIIKEDEQTGLYTIPIGI